LRVAGAVRKAARHGRRPVIARTWHGRVPSEKADAYYEYLVRTGLADYARTPGNRGVWVFRRYEAGVAHFLLTSLWESVEAIKRFAGEDYERARYYPADTEYLMELDPLVTHYEVLTPAGPGGSEQA
jgi:heme-degrading monooxygenase HmoA